MKLATESLENKEVWVKPMEFTLSKGLIGFPDDCEFELLVNSEEHPFMWIRAKSRKELAFVVIEPSQILADYAIEIADDEVRSLEVESEANILVLNIVTIRDGEDIDSATVNLVGPIILNRNTLKGKQVIVSNHMKFSTKHPILSNTTNG